MSTQVAIPSNFAIFNNWNFNNIPGLQVYQITPPMNGTRKLNIFELARRNARTASSGFFTQNSLLLSIYITAGSRTALDKALDQLALNLQDLEGTLVVPQSGNVRAYTCSYATSAINAQSGGYIDITITFECSDSFGYDTNYTVIQPMVSVSSGNTTTSYNQGGTALTQAPYFQYTYTALSANATDTVTVGNQNTGQVITVTRTWAVGDVLTVDSRNKAVQVNGLDVLFSGAFPEFQPTAKYGTQTYYYIDTFNTRTYSHYAYVYNRYL